MTTISYVCPEDHTYEALRGCNVSSLFGVFCVQEALEMVQFQLRHGNDLLAMDCIRNCDVSIFWLPWLLPPPSHYPALRSTKPIFAIDK